MVRLKTSKKKKIRKTNGSGSHFFAFYLISYSNEYQCNVTIGWMKIYIFYGIGEKILEPEVKQNLSVYCII